jgi:hypothetical protein
VISGVRNSTTDPGMSFSEKIREWSMADPADVEGEFNEDGPHAPGSATLSDQAPPENEWDEMDDEHGPQNYGAEPETIMSELDTARINFAVNTSSFVWFLKAAQSRSQLDYNTADSLESIRKAVSSALRQYRGNRALRPQQVGVRMDWDPRLFVQQQEYEGFECLNTALAITGTAMKAQLSSCRDYLNQVWPLTGEAVFEGVIAVAKDEGPITMTLFDGMRLSLELEDGVLVADCIGLFDSIVDVMEVLAWLGAALRESTALDEITYSTTAVVIGEKLAQEDQSSKFFLVFTEGKIPDADAPGTEAGGCWLRGLLRNPVIAMGFPTPLRPDDTSGLEIPLEAMALLVDSSQLTIFNNRAVLKGFNAAAVPTAYSDTIIRWHFIVNEDGNRLRYGDARNSEIPEVPPTEAIAKIQGARHILGWTSAAAYNIGKLNPWFDVQLAHDEWYFQLLTVPSRFAVSQLRHRVVES